jgi:hypothetical protein
VGTQAKLKAVWEPGSQQYRFIELLSDLKLFSEKKKHKSVYTRGGGGVAPCDIEGRRKGGEREPRGREDPRKNPGSVLYIPVLILK